ncbi:hypothetical protein PF008_g14411 [Phytophthora fragariae]|uniref:RxLR effector protein n=1 Tax=Phytophthora fragariae TaxID=53985 RepID=A0A6G0RH22_9STRA|nr:hypothetical protein PF008_g14411 [Phytophthora fragariae]
MRCINTVLLYLLIGPVTTLSGNLTLSLRGGASPKNMGGSLKMGGAWCDLFAHNRL